LGITGKIPDSRDFHCIGNGFIDHLSDR